MKACMRNIFASWALMTYANALVGAEPDPNDLSIGVFAIDAKSANEFYKEKNPKSKVTVPSNGAYVVVADRFSSYGASGVLATDVIYAANESKISSAQDFHDFNSSIKAGDVVRLKVQRAATT